MRTDTTVRDVMHREFLGVSESDRLMEAAALLVEEGTNCLVVLRGGEPVGRVACRDALDAVLDAGVSGKPANETSPTVGSVMGPPLPTVALDDGLGAVEERFVSEGVDRVVAVDDGEAVGVVTAIDLLAAGAPRTGNGAHEMVGNDKSLATNRRTETPVAEANGDTDPTVEAASTDASDSTQGVCESCGVLVPKLVTANGQAVCPECRAV